MKLLHIDSAITGDNSVSRTLTRQIVGRLTSADPTIQVVRRDLAAEPLPHLELDALPRGDGAAARASLVVLEEFLDADIVVIGAPMYNFTVPSQLKAWIDRILIAGRTFAYTAEGPKGLAAGKRVIVGVSRGGFYGPGAAHEPREHLKTLFDAVFGLIGVEPEYVIAEGVAIGPDQRTAAISQAGETIALLPA